MKVSSSFLPIFAVSFGALLNGCDQSYYSAASAIEAGLAGSDGVPLMGAPGPHGGGSTTYPGMTGVPDGILNGHFDLDTSRQVFPFSKGTTDHHVHEYDKLYKTTSIDFFNLIDRGFDQIQ